MRTTHTTRRARSSAQPRDRRPRSLTALVLLVLATVIAPPPAAASEFPRCLGAAAAGASDKCPPVLYDVFARGLDNSLVHKQFREGTGWTGWVSLGGVLGGDPGAASWSGGAIDLFARGLDSSLVHKQFRETTGWTGWIGHGGSLAGDPSVSEWGPGSLDVFARASNGTVVDKQFREASGWTWASLGTAPAGDPVAVSWGSGAIDIFARGTDGALWQRQYRAATGWTGWISRGGIIAGDPAVVTWGPGAIDVFARRASDNALVSMQYRDATGWSGWTLRSSTPLGSDPAAVSPYRGGIDVFATDPSGQVMSMQYRDAHGWTGWSSLGGVIRGTPTVTAWKYRYTSWRFGGTDRIINTTNEAQALKAVFEGAAPTERDEFLADLSSGEAAFFIQTVYPTSWQYGGANQSIDTEEDWLSYGDMAVDQDQATRDALQAGMIPADRAKVPDATAVCRGVVGNDPVAYADVCLLNQIGEDDPDFYVRSSPTSGVTPKEAGVCASYGSITCERWYGDRKEAIEMTERLWTGQAGRSDSTMANAFQHALWNALMAKSVHGEFYSSDAKRRKAVLAMSTAHEKGAYDRTDNEGRKSRMDMVNNEIGADLGVRYRSESEKSICTRVFNEVLNAGTKIPVNSDPYLYKNGHPLWRTLYEKATDGTTLLKVTHTGLGCTI